MALFTREPEKNVKADPIQKAQSQLQLAAATRHTYGSDDKSGAH